MLRRRGQEKGLLGGVRQTRDCIFRLSPSGGAEEKALSHTLDVPDRKRKKGGTSMLAGGCLSSR